MNKQSIDKCTAASWKKKKKSGPKRKGLWSSVLIIYYIMTAVFMLCGVLMVMGKLRVWRLL